MKRIRFLFLSTFIALVTLKSFVIANENPTVVQKDSNGFSLELNDPRYTQLKTYLIEMKDGHLIPAELVVPEKTRFRLVIRNLGKKPAEFESNQLRQEKVLFMGAETSVVIIPLDSGTYDYFDDFAPAMKGKIIVKGQE
jgi:hypothetical protein